MTHGITNYSCLITLKMSAGDKTLSSLTRNSQNHPFTPCFCIHADFLQYFLTFQYGKILIISICNKTNMDTEKTVSLQQAQGDGQTKEAILNINSVLSKRALLNIKIHSKAKNRGLGRLAVRLLMCIWRNQGYFMKQPVKKN